MVTWEALGESAWNDPKSQRGAAAKRWPHGDGLLVAELFFTDYPPSIKTCHYD